VDLAKSLLVWLGNRASVAQKSSQDDVEWISGLLSIILYYIGFSLSVSPTILFEDFPAKSQKWDLDVRIELHNFNSAAFAKPYLISSGPRNVKYDVGQAEMYFGDADITCSLVCAPGA
jgi:hypothetical protein